MQNIKKVSCISAYNNLLGLETLHPLVNVIDFSKCNSVCHERYQFDFYVVFLKEVKCGDMTYGRHTYDYQEGTIVCIAPGQVVGVVNDGTKYQPKGWGLCFHPDLIHGTSLGHHMSEYSFFSYNSNEALHISDKERGVFIDCLTNIQHELNHSVDRLSKRLISKNIELLLDYCLRFYERQFVTREKANHDILSKFEHLLNNYFTNNNAEQNGLPSVKHCAKQLCLSPNYFGDLIKKETGHTAQEYIQQYIIEQGKKRILDPQKNIGQVAYELGFQYPQHFTRMFKRATGITPNEYRSQTTFKRNNSHLG